MYQSEGTHKKKQGKQQNFSLFIHFDMTSEACVYEERL